jgi:hypothetical protein
MSEPQTTGEFSLCVTLPDGSTKELYKPFPKQAEFHSRSEPNVLFYGGRGSGKLLRLDTPIPTPVGMKTMASIQVGDQVLGADGLPCNVVWKSERHVDPTGTYQITFSDGTQVVAGGQHEWVTMTAAERRKAAKQSDVYRTVRRAARNPDSAPRNRKLTSPTPTGSTRKTIEILQSLREYRFTNYQFGEANHSIPVAKAWQLKDQDLLLDPYTLGAWLGDGSSSGSQITGLDEEIFAEIEKAGFEVVTLPRSPKTRCVRGLVTILKKLGVYKNKHVPEAYLFGSFDQRLALLQGLMDTDGTINKNSGQTEFTNTNKQLADSVYLLAASLGLKPNITEGRATLYGKDCGPCFDVRWTSTLPVFRLPRKLARLPEAVRSTSQWRYITNIDRIQDEEMQCIQVDNDSHLYLITAACIPTHNSKALRMEAHARAMAFPGFNYVILRRTFPQLRQSHLIELPAEMKLLGGDWNTSDKIARYPNGSTGFFRHCNDESDVYDLLSAEFAAMYFDELSTFEWDMFLKLSASARVSKTSSVPYAIIRAATNPLGPCAEEVMHFFVYKDVDRQKYPEYDPADWYAIKANAPDNPYLDWQQYQKRFAGQPEHIRKAWVEGDFALANSLFRFEPSRNGKPWHVVNDLDFKAILRSATIYRAFDWGWNPDPSYCVWIAHLGNRYIVLHEKLWNETPAKDIAADIKQVDKDLGINRVAATYCDPSIDIHHGDVVTTRDIFEMNGVPMDCSVNDRTAFAAAIHRALLAEAGPDTPKLSIYGPSCPYLTRAIPMQRYDIKDPMKLGNSATDHAPIALAYFLMSHSSLDSYSPHPTPKKKWMQPKRQSSSNLLGSESVKSSRHFNDWS